MEPDNTSEPISDQNQATGPETAVAHAPGMAPDDAARCLGSPHAPVHSPVVDRPLTSVMHLLLSAVFFSCAGDHPLAFIDRTVSVAGDEATFARGACLFPTSRYTSPVAPAARAPHIAIECAAGICAAAGCASSGCTGVQSVAGSFDVDTPAFARVSQV